MRTSGRRLTLAWLLGLGFGGLMAVAVATVFWLGWDGARQSTRDLIGLRTGIVIDGVDRAIADLLKPVEAQALSISAQVASGRLNPNKVDAWRDTVAGATSALPQIYRVVRLTPESLSYVYTPDQGDIQVLNWNKIPEVGALLSAAKAEPEGSLRWGEPVVTSALDPPQPSLILSTPLRGGDHYEGVLVLMVTLSDLSRHLVDSARQGPEVPYVLYDRGWVLAHPQLILHTKSKVLPSAFKSFSVVAGTGALMPLAKLGDPFLNALGRAEPVTDRILKAIPGTSVRLADVDGNDVVFIEREIKGYGGRPWTIGTYFDASVADVELGRLQRLMAAGAVILVLSILLAVFVAKRVARPVTQLADAARAVRGGDLSGAQRVPDTRIFELDEAGQSFNAMVDGLRERELIREQFGRYVPEAVASAILAEDGALQPTVTEATILFTDIEGFTAMSEEMRPEEIVEVLNAYFSEAADIIFANNGVITQFQGDAILATFNVPAADPEHALKAVRCAIELQRAVSGHTFAGRKLGCRVGVNTGLVVAGAVGAEGRLNYTVHGDAVNLAARLEAMNKEHGTRILISGTTAALVDGVPVREIGSVAVRGKEEPVALYAVDPGAWGA